MYVDSKNNEVDFVKKSYSKPRHIWRALWPVLVFMLPQMLVIGIALFFFAATNNWEWDTAWEIGQGTGLLFPAIGSALSLILWIPFWRKTAKRHPKQNSGKVHALPLVSTIGLWFGMSLMFGAVMWNIIPPEVTQPLVDELADGNLFIQLLMMGILAPVVEELVYRGIVFNRLSEWLPTWAVVLISSLLFGLMHFNPIQILLATAAGFILAWQYLRSRNLWIPIVGHLVFNSANAIFLNFYVTGISSMEWLTLVWLIPAGVLMIGSTLLYAKSQKKSSIVIE